nr:transglutaminase domain-containing protein [uncultured Acetatifactor sp.]
MKALKRIFYIICIILTLSCAGVAVCAFNPAITQSLAAALYGQENGRENATEEPGSGQEGQTVQETGAEEAQGQDLSAEGISPTVSEGSYVLPAGGQIVLPETVEGKTGYTPVREERQEIDSETGTAQSTASVGATGEELTFDAEIYPYYGMLQEDMQQVYRQIYANAQQLTESFSPVTAISVNQLKNVFEAVYNDHPELFWLETEYSCKYLRGGQCVEITLQFNETAAYLAEAGQLFDAAAESILEGARQLESDLDRERYVHDALVELVDYNETADMNQSAYSALVGGSTVCAGYARAFQYLMQQLNIPCYYCTGYSGQDHAWNIIRIGQEYYNVDVTWNDTNPSTYDYFNKSDEELASTHIRRGLSVYLPACRASSSQEEAQETDGEEDASQEGYLINPNPQEPLTWQSTWNNNRSQDTGVSEEDNLSQAGITADEVLSTMEEYYADCLSQMVEAGSGFQQFTNVVPESLWPTIERAYSDSSFRTQYVEEALKELGMENFAIQLQVQRLGGGYYRLYHNISTWN